MKEILGYNQFDEKIKVIIKNKKIEDVVKLDKDFDVPNQYIIPGFIETHTHGGYDFDWISGDEQKMHNFLYNVAKNEGTTSIVGTTITTDKDKIKNTLNKLSKYVNKDINGANFIGWHIEGPFINEEKKGAHPPEKMVKLTIDNINDYLKDHLKDIRIVTIAPELSDWEAIKYLNDNNVISFAGHTMATKDDVVDNIKNGIKCITHFNNAMIKYDTEGDSLAKYAISSNDLYIEFINDGIHNSKELAKLIKEKKPKDKLILITDSLHIKGLEDGTYPGPNWNIIKRDGAAWTPEGILNGSVYTMNQAFKDWVNKYNTTLNEAVLATSTNAANLLKIKKGKIEKEYDADILLIDKNNLDIIKTIVLGKEII